VSRALHGSERPPEKEKVPVTHLWCFLLHSASYPPVPVSTMRRYSVAASDPGSVSPAFVRAFGAPATPGPWGQPNAARFLVAPRTVRSATCLRAGATHATACPVGARQKPLALVVEGDWGKSICPAPRWCAPAGEPRFGTPAGSVTVFATAAGSSERVFRTTQRRRERNAQAVGLLADSHPGRRRGGR